MSTTLYFAKLNLVSDDLFELYKDPGQRKTISSALYKAIHAGQHWEKQSTYTDDDTGQLHTTTIDYFIHVLDVKEEVQTYIEGWLYKESTLHLKKLVNGRLVSRPEKNIEANRFILDVEHGFVGYNTSNRFGYKDFVEAFENIVNLNEDFLQRSYRYNMCICTSGLNLEDIKRELKSIGNIKELRICMQPPNPSDHVLESLQQGCDEWFEQMEIARATQFQTLYSTKGSSGLNLDSPLISNRIDGIGQLYGDVSVEESTTKGYVSVEAVSTSGKKYSSGDSKPIKRIIKNPADFFHACVDVFRQLK